MARANTHNYDLLTPQQVANYFLACGKHENIAITPMKLVKLVYIAYGWHLALFNKKLFEEEIVAWPHGPVIPSIYHEFKRFGSDNITDAYATTLYLDNTINSADPDAVANALDKIKARHLGIDSSDENCLKSLKAVWDNYKNKDASELSRLTHEKNSPWDKARRRPNRLLNDEEIRERCLDKILKIYDKEISED